MSNEAQESNDSLKRTVRMNELEREIECCDKALGFLLNPDVRDSYDDRMIKAQTEYKSLTGYYFDVKNGNFKEDI